MKWIHEVDVLFEKFTDTIPETFRPHVKPMLHDNAEKKCHERSGGEVNEQDLVVALFEITPEPFKTEATDNLVALGVDVNRYIKPKEIKQGIVRSKDIGKMLDDIVKAAEVAMVDYDTRSIERVLETYEAFFRDCHVTFRTTTKPKNQRGLNARYVDFDTPHDPFQIALSKGLIANTDDHPIYNLVPEIRAAFSIAGHGVDLGASHGLEKIWPFFDPYEPEPIEKAYELVSLPMSIKNQAGYFRHHGLDVFSLFAIDFLNRSTNIYFMVNALGGQLDAGRISEIITDLGFKLPSKELLDHCAKAATFYYTFTWESPNVERICFGIPVSDAALIPTHFHPVLERYVNQAPMLTDDRKFIYSITLGRSADYIKIENDYSNSMVELLKAGAPVQFQTT